MDARNEVRTQPAATDERPAEFLTFSLGDEQYAIDILKVQEIRAYERPTPIAGAPAFIKGVINLRGVIVPIVDLRVRFALSRADYTPFTVVIVLQVAGRVIGIVVDSVNDVAALCASELRPAPEFAATIDTRYIVGLASVDAHLLIVIDIERLMTSREMELIDEAAA